MSIPSEDPPEGQHGMPPPQSPGISCPSRATASPAANDNQRELNFKGLRNLKGRLILTGISPPNGNGISYIQENILKRLTEIFCEADGKELCEITDALKAEASGDDLEIVDCSRKVVADAVFNIITKKGSELTVVYRFPG